MRVLNRLLALLVGVTFVSAGLAIAAEAVAVVFGRPPLFAPWPAWVSALQTLPWADPRVRATSCALALAGILVLVAEVRPWPRERLALPSDPPVHWWLHRRSLERCLAARVQRTTGSAADVRVHLRVHRRRLDVLVDAAAPTRERSRIEQTLETFLDALGIPGGRRVDVRLRHDRRLS